MDTRTKILTQAALAALDPPRPLLLAVGRFDILRVDTAQELEAARRRTGAKSLLAVVQPLAGELAPLPSRAEMAAALRLVDYVYIAEDGNFAELAASLHPIEIIDLEDAEARRIRQLREDVRRRRSDKPLSGAGGS
jgi:bifunctional ADP-heptose synthase (sugar kinase/adenylyltransferase)